MPTLTDVISPQQPEKMSRGEYNASLKTNTLVQMLEARKPENMLWKDYYSALGMTRASYSLYQSQKGEIGIQVLRGIAKYFEHDSEMLSYLASYGLDLSDLQVSRGE